MSQRPPAKIGQRLEEVDTPALILDLRCVRKKPEDPVRSGRRTACACARTPRRTSAPRSRSARCALGAVGMCCQKVSEAEAMVDGGIGDVLVSATRSSARRSSRASPRSRAARKHRRLRRQRGQRARHAPQHAGAKLDVYIEIDVGMRRCGVAPGEPAVALAREIVHSTNLRFAGLQAYHGRAQHIRSMEERHAVIETAAQHVEHTKTTARGGRHRLPDRHRRGQRHLHARGRGRRLGRDPARLVRLHGRGLREERMGGAAAALRACALRAQHRDEPAFAADARSSTPASRRRASTRACRASGSGRACVIPMPRTSMGGSKERIRAAPGREAAARAGPLRPDDQSVRLVRCRIRGGVVVELWPITARGRFDLNRFARPPAYRARKKGHHARFCYSLVVNDKKSAAGTGITSGKR